MRKFINASLAVVMLFGFSALITGCTEESGKDTTKITTPDGSQTRDIKGGDQTGKMPPAPPGGKTNNP
jgi:hypothetical protein